MCDFKRLNKWIKEKTKIDYEHINIIFLGMTFLTFVLSEIIISAVNNATEIIPNWVHYLFSLTFGLILFLAYYLVMNLNFGKIWKLFIGIVFLMIYFSLIVGYAYNIPHSYVWYKFSCPNILTENSKIDLNILNKGKIVSKNFVRITLPKKDIELRLNTKPISNNIQIVTFSGDNLNYSIIFFKMPKFNNETIVINNAVDCGWQLNCRSYHDGYSENTCEYTCEDNKCKLISKS